ncbi:MAG: tRNA pseudouridine(55) synthase TruB [Planctomycetes bacterium]|nr:tRNA pseudouridine(55) synthase TruB [Planctomycetota bacterium]
MPHFGLLNIHKPPGMTSRRVVDRVVRLVGKKTKVGHAGTLDPLATGVLVVCLGRATRLIEYVQRMPKRYTGTFLLGRTSTTEDVEGEVTELVNPPLPTRESIEQAAQQLVGQIQQRPPAFSALKIDGRRAYDLARRGETPDLKPRTITVHSIELLSYEYPQFVLDIRCGSGTYVRSLGRDLAESLGTGAVMSALERTAIGGFRLTCSDRGWQGQASCPWHPAVDLDELTADNLSEHLHPALIAVESLPSVTLTADQYARIANGQTIGLTDPPDADEIAALDSVGRLAAILIPRDNETWRPLRFFPRD